MDSFVNGSIDAGSYQDDLAAPARERLLPEVKVKRRNLLQTSKVQPDIALGNQKRIKRYADAPLTVKVKKPKVVVRDSLKHEDCQRKQQFVTLPQYYDMFKKKANKQIRDEYMKGMVRDVERMANHSAS